MVRESWWLFPTLETLHFIGLILLLGALLIMDLRYLGLASRAPLSAVMRYLPVAVLGFTINLATGILFVVSDPFRYVPNPAFQLKMLAVLLSGINALWFKFAVDWHEVAANPEYTPGRTVRLIAGISLALWMAVIVLGRFIPYVE